MLAFRLPPCVTFGTVAGLANGALVAAVTEAPSVIISLASVVGIVAGGLVWALRFVLTEQARRMAAIEHSVATAAAELAKTNATAVNELAMSTAKAVSDLAATNAKAVVDLAAVNHELLMSAAANAHKRPPRK